MITKKKLDANIEKDFKMWRADTSYFREYEDYEIKQGDVLIRMYQYTPRSISKKAQDLVDEKGAPLVAKSYRRVFPFAMVIKCNNNESSPFDINPGSIVSVADAMCSTKLNPDWQYAQEMMKERPAPEIEMPPKYVNKFSEWQKYLFIGNKFKTEPDDTDAFTFLIPQTFLKSKYTK